LNVFIYNKYENTTKLNDAVTSRPLSAFDSYWCSLGVNGPNGCS